MRREEAFLRYAEILETHARVARNEKDELAKECIDTKQSVSDVIKRLHNDIMTELLDEELCFSFGSVKKDKDEEWDD